jgi:hypothetical protein
MMLSDSQTQCLEQLAKEKGYTTCYNCESRRIGVHELASDWALGGSFRVVLKCSDCYADGGHFIISPEESWRCGLDPSANLPTDVP